MLRQPLTTTLFPYTTLFRSIGTESIGALGKMFSFSGISNYFDNIQGDKNADPNQRFLSPVGFGRVANQAVNDGRSEEHTSELQSLRHLVCRLLLEKKKQHHDVLFIHNKKNIPTDRQSIQLTLKFEVVVHSRLRSIMYNNYEVIYR